MKGGGVKRRATAAKKTVKRRKITQKAKRRSAKAATSSQYLTDQFDKRVDYVAIKKPRKDMKKDNMFKAKVIKALTPQVPTINKLYTTSAVSVTNTGSSDQCYVIFHMRPWEGQAAVPGSGSLYNEPAQVDLQDIYSELGTGYNAGADKLSTDFTVVSSVMDIFVEPTGTTDCMFEVYEIVYQKKKGNPIDEFGSLFAAYDKAYNTPWTGPGTGIQLTNRGASPFDLTLALRNYGVKVIKKSTNFVQTGSGGFTYTVKDYRQQPIQGLITATENDNKFCLQGWTKSVLILCKTLVSDSSTVTGFRASREAHYRIRPEMNELAFKAYTGLN